MQAEIELGYAEYQQASLQMYHDPSYLLPLKAAILAPSVFLKDINNFEVTFDAIISLLELAMTRTSISSETEQIQRIAQELFHGHIFLIEQKISNLRALASRGFKDRLIDVFSSNPSIPEPAFVLPAAIIAGATSLMSVEATIVLAAYFEKLYTQWKITQKSDFFYVQLARTYRKMLTSNIYNEKFSILNHTIDRNKIEIVKSIIATREWDEGIEFMASIEYRSPFSFSMLQSNFYRGYRISLMKRNFVSTYLYFVFLYSMSTVLTIVILFQNWEGAVKAFLCFLVIFLAVYFGRFEHRLVSLKAKIRRRVKEMRG